MYIYVLYIYIAASFVCRRVTLPVTSLLLRETHSSKWAELAAAELSSPLQGLFGDLPPFAASEAAAAAAAATFAATEGSENDSAHADHVGLLLAAFALPVLRDTRSLSVADIPFPTYCLLPSEQTTDTAAAASAAMEEDPQQQQQQQMRGLLPGQWCATADSCSPERSTNAGSAFRCDPLLRPQKENQQQQQQQPLMWGPKGLIDGSWFLGGAFGPASIPDISGLMNFKQKEEEEKQQPAEDVLPLPLKFLQLQVSLELNSDDELPQHDSAAGGAGGGSAAAQQGGLVQSTTAAEAAFESSSSSSGPGAAAVPSSRAVRSKWHYLLQRNNDKRTNLQIINKRKPQNDIASAAARTAKQRPWCQQQIQSQLLLIFVLIFILKY